MEKGRTAAAGASYGGYMVDWIAGHTDRYRVLVSHDGVFDLRSMYGATEELWFPEWEFRGPYWANREMYERWSPANFVQNFKTPTLVVHSELDYRVPLEQGLGMFTALQRRGRAVAAARVPGRGPLGAAARQRRPLVPGGHRLARPLDEGRRRRERLRLRRALGTRGDRALRDARAGLRAVIAMHDTTLGPAIGGTRMRLYASQEEALLDALRLAGP